MLLRLPRNVAALSNLAAAAEHTRFGATTGIMAKLTDQGVLRLEATDGRCLGIVQCYPEDDVEMSEMVVDQQNLDPDNGTHVIVDAKEWKKAFSKLSSSPRYGRPNSDSIVLATQGCTPTVVEGEEEGTANIYSREAVFATLTERMVTPSVEGRFPNTDQVIPKMAPLYVIRVDPRILIRVLQTAMAFCHPEAMGVDLIYYDRKTPLGIVAKNHETGQMFDGLVVPLVASDDTPRVSHTPDPCASHKAITHEPDEEEGEEEELPKLSELYYRVEFRDDDGDVQHCLIPIGLTENVGMDEAFRRTMEMEFDRIVSYDIDECFDADGCLVDEWDDDIFDDDGNKKESEKTMLDQYLEAKDRHPDMLLLFRMGDFYEMYGDDAEAGAKILGLTLTSRTWQTPVCGGQIMAMAGFPHHALEKSLHKLLAAGKRVAICDPVESEDREVLPTCSDEAPDHQEDDERPVETDQCEECGQVVEHAGHASHCSLNPDNAKPKKKRKSKKSKPKKEKNDEQTEAGMDEGS